MILVKSRPKRSLVPGIRFRLFLLGFIPAGFILLCLVSYYAHIQFTNLNLALQQRGNTIVRQFAAAVADRTTTDDRPSLQHLADSLLTEGDILQVRILNDTGQILVLARHPKRDQKNDYLLFEEIINPKFFPIKPETNSRAPSFSKKQRASELQNSEVLGKVQIYLSTSAASQNQRTSLLNSVLMALSGLAAAFLFAYFMVKWISIPLLDLIQTVSAITSGNLGARVNYSGNPELRELQRGLNTMVAALQKNQAHLEKKIYTATLRLQETLRSIEEKNIKLEEARLQADKQNKTKSQFLAHVSHEIRTPMNGILGFVELLSKTELNPTQLDQLTLIEESAKNLLTIINEILDLSKLESGEFKLTPTTFNLRNYLEDTVSLLCPQHDHLEIILYIQPDFPTWIKGDPIRLQQIVTNLLGNSLKFTDSGRIVIRTTKLQVNEQDYALLSVSDTGCGIARKNQKDLFSPFLRLTDFDINHYQGTGLGLAISKNIIERMKGCIGVISRPNVGSTFWIKLPLFTEHSELPGKIELSVNLIDGSTLSINALQSQLASLEITSQRFDSVEQFVNSSNRYDAGVSAVTILMLTPHSSTLQINHAIEILTKHHKSKIFLAGNNNQLDLLKTCSENHANGFISLPCRSPFLFNSLIGPSKKTGPIETQQSGKTKNGFSCNNLTFLVSDDNEINRILLKSQLLQTGAVVLEARDGKESIELLNAVAFDLIFLDLQMPVMNGMDIMRYISENKNINQKTPVIAVTAHALPHQRTVVLRAGFADCLIKPLLQSRLEHTLAKYIGQTNKLVRQPAPASGVEIDHLIETLLLKTNGDIDLASHLLNQLFREMPEQLHDIERSILDSDLDKALQITHKLNGSLSFCAIEKARKAAGTLENSLTDCTDKTLINGHYRILKSQIEILLSLQDEILKTVWQRNKTSPESSH